MKGVQIEFVQEKMVVTTDLKGWQILIVIVIAIAVLIGIMMLLAYFDADDTIATIIGLFTAFAMIIIAFNVTTCEVPETRYGVKVSKEASWIEFEQKYEVIEKMSDDFYIVREKQGE